MTKLMTRWFPMSAIALALFGCAESHHFREAQSLWAERRTEEALARYKAASLEQPTNANYRIAYLNARDRTIRTLLDQAEQARRSQQPELARAAYLRIQSIDDANALARNGLEALDRDQRHSANIERAREAVAQGNLDKALTELRGVLAENPQHADASAMRTRLFEQRARPKAVMDARLQEAYRRPVSLEFKEAQLKQVFEVLSRSSGLNFVLDKDVRGDQRTTIFLRNSTISDALALTLLTNQLEQRVLDGNSVLIYPNNAAKLREYQPLTVKSFILSNAEAKVVANTLKTILKTKDVVIDENQNMIVMRDSPEAVEMAERLVALHDQPEAEVMLDVEILEVKHSRLRQLGVQYPSQLSLTPLASATGGQLTLSDLHNINSQRIGAATTPLTLNANEEFSDINVLANPRIRSRNREKAKIQVGQRVPNITSTSTSTGFVSETVQYVDVGLKLEVEPVVSANGEVAIKISLEVSNILRQVQTKSGSVAYEIGTRTASTVLRLRDGENQVLAGLINDEDRRSGNRIPGLGNVPVVGDHLFGSRTDDLQKSEVVLSITPRVIRHAQRPDLLVGEFDSGTEASLRAKVFDGSGSAAGRGASLAKAPSQPPGTEGGAPAAGTAPASPAGPAAAGEAPALPPASPSATSPTPVPAASTEPPPTEPLSPAAPAATAGPDGVSTVFWRGANTVQVGSEFTIELWGRTEKPLAVVPMGLRFDPRRLAVVQVEAGDFLAKAGSSASLNKRTDADAGIVQAVLTAGGQAASTGAEGGLLKVTFKALTPTDSTPLVITEPISAVTPTGESLSLGTPGSWAVRIKGPQP